MKPKLWTMESDGEHLLGFHCPGCRYAHCYRVRGEQPLWQWNGSMESPTFSPSLLINQHDPAQRCHLFVRNGKIEFLGDCFHELKGQVIEMEDARH